MSYERKEHMISIIIPFFDEFHYIRRAIHSCLQISEFPFEILIVNDNPSHISPEDFDKLGLSKYVRVIHHDTNRGLQAARNSGVKAALGTHLLFLDSDDYFLPDSLDDLLRYAVDEGADLTHFNTMTGRADKRRIKTYGNDREFFSKKEHLTGGDVAIRGSKSLSTWSCVYRAGFLQEKGIRGDEEQRKFEDRLYVLQTMLAAESLAIYPKSVRVWCRRRNSITTSQNSVEDLVLKGKSLRKVFHTIQESEHKDEVIDALLLQELTLLFSQIITGGTDKCYQDIYLLENTSQIAKIRKEFSEALSPLRARFADGELYQALKQKLKKRGRKPDDISLVQFQALWDALISNQGDDFRDLLFDVYPRIENKRNPLFQRPEKIKVTDSADGVDYLIHIGLHKTGTTLIQTTFDKNRSKLAKQGILFPLAGFGGADAFKTVKEGGVPGHDKLRIALLNDDQEQLAELEQEIRLSRCKTVLISAENFCGDIYSSGIRGPLRKFSSQIQKLPLIRSVRFVVYLRNPVEWMDSFYRESLAAGFRSALSVNSAEEFASNMIHRVDYARLIHALEMVSGQNVIVGDFEAAKEIGPVSHFASNVFGDAASEITEILANTTGQKYSGICNAQVDTLHHLRAVGYPAQVYKAIAREFLQRTDPTKEKSLLLNWVIATKVKNRFLATSKDLAQQFELDALLASVEDQSFSREFRETSVPAHFATECYDLMPKHSVLDGVVDDKNSVLRYREVTHIANKKFTSNLILRLYRLTLSILRKMK